MKIAKDIISNYTNTYIEIQSKGDNEIERSLYLIHLTDWISVYLADLREMDPVEVKVIDKLKAELAG
jgi:glucose/mannose-6-phosphate isomerase